MFHVELRKFPHSFWRFNLSEAELREAILDPWVRGMPLDAGERRWSPHEATLTVIEGPRLAVADLSMGRGWRTAVRRGEDVTARVVAQVRDDADAASPGTGVAHEGDALAELLGERAETLLGLWRAARERHPERTPSECLALAESAMRTEGGDNLWT